MKTILAAAVVATTFTFTGPFSVEEANAGGRNERIAVCDHYRAKAQAHGRRGNVDRADYFWHLFTACLNHRID